MRVECSAFVSSVALFGECVWGAHSHCRRWWQPTFRFVMVTWLSLSRPAIHRYRPTVLTLAVLCAYFFCHIGASDARVTACARRRSAASLHCRPGHRAGDVRVGRALHACVGTSDTHTQTQHTSTHLDWSPHHFPQSLSPYDTVAIACAACRAADALLRLPAAATDKAQEFLRVASDKFFSLPAVRPVASPVLTVIVI